MSAVSLTLSIPWSATLGVAVYQVLGFLQHWICPSEALGFCGTMLMEVKEIHGWEAPRATQTPWSRPTTVLISTSPLPLALSSTLTPRDSGSCSELELPTRRSFLIRRY